MKKLFSLFIVFVFLLGASLYFFRSREDIVYFVPGFFGGPFAEKGKQQVFPFYGRDLPKMFQEYGLKIKTPKSYKKCTNAKKIIIFDLLSNYNLTALAKHSPDKLSLFLWEPPSTLPEDYEKKNHAIFSRIYTWDDDLVDNKKYFKFNYPEAKPMIKESIPFEKKKLCALICRNKKSSHPNELYSERKNVILFFERKAPQDFDFYGAGWEMEKFSTYCGAPSSKECLKNYKFCFTYENIHNINGYITEKIFDSFRYGCVPIYWGAENIEKYIPANCFIDRRKFSSNEELYTYLKNMTKEEHELYIKNIRSFLESEKVKPFLIETFFKTFTEAAGIEKL